MNWNAVGAVGQILGSLATFVTVGYLVIQVHDTEKEMQRAVVEGRTDRNTQANMTVAADERLVSILKKANDALAGDKPKPPFLEAATKQLGLTEEEAYSLYRVELVSWGNLALSINYVDDLPPEDRAQMDRTFRFRSQEPVFKFWYEFTKPQLNPKAVRYVDNLLAQPVEGTL